MRGREPQSWGVTLMWLGAILLFALIPQDAYSAGMVDVETPAAVVKVGDNSSFRGSISGGVMVNNRDEETGSSAVVRIDTQAKLKVVGEDHDQWRPVLRTSAEFAGFPSQGVDLEDPTTFRQLDFYASVGERLFPGFEVGVGGGFAVNLAKGGRVASQKSPANWDVHGRFYSGDNYLKVGIGQAQEVAKGWTQSAAVKVEAQYDVPHQEGRIKFAIRGDVVKSLRGSGDTVARIAVVVKLGVGGRP